MTNMTKMSAIIQHYSGGSSCTIREETLYIDFLN